MNKRGHLTMNMNIENISPCDIAYIRQTGAYGEGNIKTMEQLKKWATAHNLIHEKTVILGIVHDNPQITPPGNCRYDACIILPEKLLVTENKIHYGELIGGQYAVFTVEHTVQAIEQAWAEIFQLLSQSGYFTDDTRPILERYAADKIEKHLCEICVPVFSQYN